MLMLQLNDREAETLAEVLRSYLAELRSEVVHTDSHDYREGLKAREVVLKEIIAKVEKPIGL